MLTKQDIEWMKENRNETTENRTTLITIGYESEGTKDPITDEIIPGKRVDRDVDAVVTEISSQAGTGIERRLENGVTVEDGDIWLSIKFDAPLRSDTEPETRLISDVYEQITELRYDGDWYAILALDKKGIGKRNRIEVLGRVIT